eukprot:CAMPEP_0194305126 /NCGR_PEP_ID=MMETSP0171-20130528/2634_1 /TAXON_ID=218684 /ORGANISM="Corethron pennatum, Strain L29A3" /LENGTH=374 /DNA_ID=CAMNT_0039056557 /DNA_START=84 /DNA_END=1209 /DNA_ORIENTATION=+
MPPALSLLIVASALALARAKLSCIGDNGDEVDYFIILKMPNSGKYMYLDSFDQNFKKSPQDLSSSSRNNAVSATFAQVYADEKTDVGFVMYNDMHPDGKLNDSRAHSKGVMALDSEQGFWTIHSVPGFPNAVDDKYEPLTNGLRFGQHFMCMTMAPDQFNSLGRLGQINWPSQFDSHLPDSLRGNNSDFADFVDGKENKDTLSTSIQIKSVGGQKFTVFAKNAHWGGSDLYEDLVAPGLGVSLQANTWQNGIGNPMDSYCKGGGFDYTVVNVATQDRGGTTWKESQDHSKWAIAYFPFGESRMTAPVRVDDCATALESGYASAISTAWFRKEIAAAVPRVSTAPTYGSNSTEELRPLRNAESSVTRDMPKSEMH